MIKPKRRELIAALIVCVVLVGAAIYVNTQNTNYPTQGLTGGLELLPKSYSQPVAELEDARVKDIRHWMKGELTKGRFEDVLLAIEEKTEEHGGYVYSEDMTFADDLWTGQVVSRIPQNKSTLFVFQVRQIITQNGRVVSITTSIRDITGSVWTSEQKPHATIGVTLAEITDKPIIGIPLVAGIIPYLTTFFTWVTTGVILGLPTYFTLLGVVLLIDRALIPIANKLFKGRLSKGGKGLSSQES